jgi:tRNA-splicing ligase RtcB (3'-phosphate/5'-hydroxy nucleic acid ligase)
MPATEVSPKLLVWGADSIEPSTLRQAEKAARLSFVPDHVALMPDAHVGIGVTVGSVIPTLGAIIPAAVGVDIGCGMAALETGLRAEQLPDDMKAVLDGIEQSVPAGLGKGRNSDGTGTGTVELPTSLREQPAYRKMNQQLRAVAGNQLCTLGSGNHFVEGTPQFEAYIADMVWAQDYAAENRREMLSNVFKVLRRQVPAATAGEVINCHHNFTRKEHISGVRSG